MNVDYLIVGCGLAGISFAEKALENNKTILVFDNNSQNSSQIAGGLYNPVILKRFSEVWNAEAQVVLLDEFFRKIEFKLNTKLDFKTPILRKFFSVEEQNNWFAASDKPGLTPFLAQELIFKSYKGIEASFGYGQVLHTGYVDTALLLNTYKKYLLENNLLIKDSFDYKEIKFENECIQYKNIQAKHIIFAEGFGMHSNPFFCNFPLDGTKGELFIIKAPNLDLDVIINTSVFIMPIGNNLFKVGATYNWKDKTNVPTEEAKIELVTRIKEILNCDFEIIEHFAGVRPTVRDRKPLVGTHFLHKNVHILNGLGTRGVMLAPMLALNLFENIEFDKPLNKVIDIQRYYKKML